jgi:hypothetical protein
LKIVLAIDLDCVMLREIGEIMKEKQKEIILKPGESVVIASNLPEGPEGTKPEDTKPEDIVVEYYVNSKVRLKLLLIYGAFIICLFVYYIARNMGRLSIDFI